MPDDTKMTALARKIITRNWFDVTRLRVRVTRKVIFISGRIYRLTGSAAEREGDVASLRKLDEDLHSIPGVRGVAYQLENWVQEGASWRQIGQKMTKAARAALNQPRDIG